MSDRDRIELKVGDRVRLLGKLWGRYGLSPDTVVTVTLVKNGIPYSEWTGPLLGWNGEPRPGLPIEKVADAEDSNEQAAADARIIAELRKFHDFMAATNDVEVLIELKELSLLLRIADKYQALKRSLVDGGER